MTLDPSTTGISGKSLTPKLPPYLLEDGKPV
jgi:hypothetical protein